MGRRAPWHGIHPDLRGPEQFRQPLDRGAVQPGQTPAQAHPGVFDGLEPNHIAHGQRRRHGIPPGQAQRAMIIAPNNCTRLVTGHMDHNTVHRHFPYRAPAILARGMKFRWMKV
jgi:hypothetical protein